MSTYNTGDPPGMDLEKSYEAIWEVVAHTQAELLALEKRLHEQFHSVRRMRAGKKTEWFNVSFEAVERFLNSQSYVIRQLSIQEVRIIQARSEDATFKDDDDDLVEETTHIEVQDVSLTPPMTLKEEFFATFLPPGYLPRRIQSELWDSWEKISENTLKYKGIVQWATGTGKTLAILMLFVLSANASQKRGEVFRGLLIAPTNDIFDTIMHHIRKLSKWGIVVCEGHDGSLSTLPIPLDRPLLVTATHASLTNSDNWQKLPSMTHCHYDEVHRITGDEFYKLLTANVDLWDTAFLTGTSATPKTCITSQHKKIAELFGTPLQILHKCDVDEAILEGWIAQPRFGVNIVSNCASRIDIVGGFVDTIHRSILDKQVKGLWKGGKMIAYLPSRTDVCNAVTIAKAKMPDWHIYTAVEDADGLSDDTFVRDYADGQPRILFACERYREGSDIKGVEMTAILMGNTIGAHILLQIVGRALRNDYEGKEGWCVIVRPSDEGTSEDEVFDSILLQIMEFIGNDDATTPSTQRIKRVVERFFGPVTISGKVYNVTETIHRIQSMYARKAFERSDAKEKYEVIRAINKDMGLKTRDAYSVCASHHSKYIADPKAYFNDSWVSWYHFLGMDTSAFPQTKSEWICICKDMGIDSWDSYKKTLSSVLPANPGEMYEDYTNWDKEFEVEERIDW